MAIMHALSTSVDDFPYQLISNSRHLIDCIDVQDIIPPDPYSPISSSGSGNSNTLHCTLFLFNDKLMIVKRPSEKSGRSAAGLDQLDKIAKGSILPASMRKSGLVCKGVVDITDVVATDVGGAGVSHINTLNRSFVTQRLVRLLCALTRHASFPGERSVRPIRALGRASISRPLCGISSRSSLPRSYTYGKGEAAIPWQSMGDPSAVPYAIGEVDRPPRGRVRSGK